MSYFCIFLNQVKSHSKPPLVRVARTFVSIILHLSTNNNSGTLLNLPGRQKNGSREGLGDIMEMGSGISFLSTDLMGWSWRTRERHMALGFSHEHWVEPERCLSNPYVSATSLCFFCLFVCFNFFLLYWKKVKVKSLSRVWLFATPWTVACQAPPSIGFSRQEYSSGLPFPSPGDLPDTGIKPESPALQAESLPFEPPV